MAQDKLSYQLDMHEHHTACLDQKNLARFFSDRITYNIEEAPQMMTTS